MSRGLSEDAVHKLEDYENSDLPDRTKAALRLADRLAAGVRPQTESSTIALGATSVTTRSWAST